MTNETKQILSEMQQIDADLEHRRQAKAAADRKRLAEVDRVLTESARLDREGRMEEYAVRTMRAAEATKMNTLATYALVLVFGGLLVLLSFLQLAAQMAS